MEYEYVGYCDVCGVKLDKFKEAVCPYCGQQNYIVKSEKMKDVKRTFIDRIWGRKKDNRR